MKVEPAYRRAVRVGVLATSYSTNPADAGLRPTHGVHLWLSVFSRVRKAALPSGLRAAALRSMSHERSRRYWETASGRLAGRINLALWCERFAPVAFAIASIGAVALYAARRVGEEQVSRGSWLLAAALGVAGGVVVWRAKSHFFRAADARVLLEASFRLDARLTAATEGVTGWPTPAELPSILRWRMGPTATWLSAAAALVAGSLWLPVPRSAARAPVATEKPPALAQTEALLQQIKEIAVAEPKSIEQLEQKAQELAHRPPEQQYTHSGLEAADTLREQTLSALENLARKFESAETALKALEQNASALTDEQLNNAAGNLSTALEGMRDGKLAAAETLQAALNGLDASKLRSLTPEQMAELRKKMADAGQRSRGVRGAAGQVQVATLDKNAPAMEAGGGTEDDGSPSPLSFSETPTDAKANKIERLSSLDDNPPALGDLVEITRDKHENDPNKPAGAATAGAVAEPSRGSEAAWVERLTPAERAALKTFFK